MTSFLKLNHNSLMLLLTVY